MDNLRGCWLNWFTCKVTRDWLRDAIINLIYVTFDIAGGELKWQSKTSIICQRFQMTRIFLSQVSFVSKMTLFSLFITELVSFPVESWLAKGQNRFLLAATQSLFGKHPKRINKIDSPLELRFNQIKQTFVVILHSPIYC